MASPHHSNAMDQSLHELLVAYREGEPGVLDKLIPLVYEDLRRLARRQVHQWPNLTLDTTGVVHEAYLKLSRQHALDANDRAHFLAICSQAMRQFIINYARQKLADKRGANLVMHNIEDTDIPIQGEADELLLIDQALRGLGEANPRLVRVFECRFFAGLTEAETMEALNLPLRTVQRDWMRARAWVRDMLAPSADSP
jgi:RNA polymerase sigma factor (TIGR02999 family)